MMLEHIGELRHRVRIDAQAQGTDGAGNISTTWSPVFPSIAAKMEGVAAQQAYRAGREEGLRRYECVIRYRPNIGTNNRLHWRGRNFDIEGVLNLDGRRQFLTLYLHERDADGDAQNAAGDFPE